MLDQDDFLIAALVQEGQLSPAQADEAARLALERRIGKVDALIDRGALTGRQAAIARAVLAECPFVDLDHYQLDFRLSDRLPRSQAEALAAFPLFDLGDIVTVAMANPLELRAVDQLRTLLRAEIEPVLCEPALLRRLIDRAYALSGGRDDAAGTTSDAADQQAQDNREPIVAAVNQILAQAIEQHASDIHLGPDESTLHLRYRVDGVLQPQQGPGLSAHRGLIQRLKVMAGLDLTQSRRPQDGKFRFSHQGRSVDVRLSIIPTVCGENAVMRLLTSAGAIRGFPELGLSAPDIRELELMLDHPHGMLLVTGPTGSGKTTTLYTALKRLNTPDRNIMTIEDPVEVRMPLIRQVQVHTEIGMTFAGALRSILRQDPDVVLVGEIRDEETARIAVQAALTGHLVLSSLHTTDAAGAMPRLADLGCPGFAINAALLGVVGQRLVRTICDRCTRPTPPDPALLARFGLQNDPATYAAGAGCPRCASTGYRGRAGIYEVLRLNAAHAGPVRAAVERNAPVGVVREAALRAGLRPMWKDGLDKARLGVTTLAEVVAVVAAVELEPGHNADPDPTPAPSAPDAQPQRHAA